MLQDMSQPVLEDNYFMRSCEDKACDKLATVDITHKDNDSEFRAGEAGTYTANLCDDHAKVYKTQLDRWSTNYEEEPIQ
jgi:hypothetical protein